MKKNVLMSWLMVAMLVPVLNVFCGEEIPTGFKADMIVVENNDTVTSKIYVKGLKYRMESEEGGQQIIIIVDQKAGLTRACLVKDKTYVEMPCDDMRSLMNDPFQSLKLTSTMPEAMSKPLGTETVNGFECDKSTTVMSDMDVMTQWISGKLGFPLRIVAHSQDDKLVELTNIEESVIDDALFELPEEFSAMEKPQPKAEVQPEVEILPEETTPAFPEWVGNVSSAKLVALPFEQVMKSGEMVRIKVEDGKNIWLMATNNHGGESTLLMVPFLNGQPIDDPSVIYSDYVPTRKFEMMMEGQGQPFTLEETPSEADDVVIRVDQGEVKIKGEYNLK